MFEDIQRRNRSPGLTAVSFVVSVFLALYFLVKDWSKRDHDELAGAFTSRDDADGPLQRVELPGMVIEMPGRPARVGDYVTGGAEVGHVAVGWMGGTPLDDPAILQRQFKVFGIDRAPTATQLGGVPAYESSHGKLHLVVGSCGSRTVVVRADVEETRFAQIKASFHCVPDRELMHLGVIVAAHEGWRRVDGNIRLHLTSKTQELSMQSRREQRDPRGATMAADATMETRGDYRIWRGAGTAVDGGPLLFALVDWKCKDQPWFGEIMISGKSSTDEGVEVALTGSCIAMDAPLPSHLQVR